MREYAQGTTSGTLNATIFAALIPTQAFRASALSVPAFTLRNPLHFLTFSLLQPVERHMEGWMTGADDQDRGRPGDDIPAAIANLGVIIGGPAVRPPANDNRAKPEAEGIGSSGNSDEVSTD
jgi:hypothetical protein